MLKQLMIGAALSAAVLTTGTPTGAQVTPAHRVLVIPFTTLNVPEGQQWIARGVQENIVADFGRNGGWAPVAFQGQVVVEDNATAARLGKQASANYAIRGSAQVVGPTVRLTAQLIDATTGDTLSTAAVTGSPNDLLRLEDELSSQLRLGPSNTQVAGTAPAPAEQPQEAAQPQIIVVTQPSSPALGYDPNAYYSQNGYGGYGAFGYPGLWWPVVIPLDDHHHHHDDPCLPAHRPDNCPPPAVPTPVHAFPHTPQPIVRGGGGFSLPIPQSPGFGLPLPQSGSGFALPIPQSGNGASVTRVAAPAAPAAVRPWAAPVYTAPRMSAPSFSAPRMSAPSFSAPAARPSAGATQFVSFHR